MTCNNHIINLISFVGHLYVSFEWHKKNVPALSPRLIMSLDSALNITFAKLATLNYCFCLAHFNFIFFSLPMARETWVQSQVESYQRLEKWHLIRPCLTLSIIRFGKGDPFRERSSTHPTPWCSSNRKGSLLVTFEYGHQLYLLLFIVLVVAFTSR